MGGCERSIGMTDRPITTHYLKLHDWLCEEFQSMPLSWRQQDPEYAAHARAREVASYYAFLIEGHDTPYGRAITLPRGLYE